MEKVQLPASLFGGKVKVDDPSESQPRLKQQSEEAVTKEEATPQRELDTLNVTGADDVCPHVLKHKLAAPLTTVFSACLRETPGHRRGKKFG